MTEQTEPQKTHQAQKIVPCIWFDHTAEEAAAFYSSVFRDVQVTTVERYPDDTASMPDFQKDFAGEALTVEIEIAGFRIVLLNAGSEFTPNPSLNFMLHFDPVAVPDAREYLDAVHEKLLADGGFELMPLQSYDFSPHYSWVQDKFGVSWQLLEIGPNPAPGTDAETGAATGAGDGQAGGAAASPAFPFVMPSFMFGGDHQNECAAAVDAYLELIPGSESRSRVSYATMGGTPDLGPDMKSPVTDDSVVYSDFALGGVWFTAMDSGAPQPFTFTEGVSLILNCADQAEIDRYWDVLSAVPEAEACGWCKDAHGVSWQIVPENWTEMSKRPGAYAKVLTQKKIIIAEY